MNKSHRLCGAPGEAPTYNFQSEAGGQRQSHPRRVPKIQVNVAVPKISDGNKGLIRKQGPRHGAQAEWLECGTEERGLLENEVEDRK